MQHAYSRVEVAERITSEEFLRRAPEDQKAELIDGVMLVAPPPLDIHERLVLFLIRLLGEFVERWDLGELRGSRTAVTLADDQTYEPDLLFISHERDLARARAHHPRDRRFRGTRPDYRGPLRLDGRLRPGSQAPYV